MYWESFYRRLPVFLQNTACGLVGWRIQRTRYGAGFQRHLKETEERADWSQDRILEYRDTRLRAFVEHCAETVPYYRRLFKREGIDPKRIRTQSDLKQVPILTKSAVRQNYPEMLSEAVPPRQRVRAHTSGTTGAGLRFASTLDAIQQQWATWWRYRRWHGIEMDTWCGYFGGASIVPIAQTSPPFWRYNRPGRQVLFSGYHISPENLDCYVEELRRRRPPWIHGYPSAIGLLASHLIDTQTDLGYQVRSITVGSENFLAQQSSRIDRALGVRPRQHYGMAEAVANISQCESGSLHVDEDFSAVEFLPHLNGSGDRIIGTNFTNLATPLLRYDTGDIAVLADGVCSCGRPGRVVQSIDGRCEDYIVLKNGALVGRLDHIFKDLVNIREAQIRQSQVGEISICVVRGNAYTDTDERQLLRETRRRLGDGMTVYIQYVENLQRTTTGKLRLVVSNLTQGHLASRPDGKPVEKSGAGTGVELPRSSSD